MLVGMVDRLLESLVSMYNISFSFSVFDTKQIAMYSPVSIFILQQNTSRDMFNTYTSQEASPSTEVLTKDNQTPFTSLEKHL
jgi:hypothetical protein